MNRRHFLASIAGAIALRYLPELHEPLSIDWASGPDVTVTTLYYPNGSCIIVGNNVRALWAPEQPPVVYWP